MRGVELTRFGSVSGVQLLPAGAASLAKGLPPAPPGTLFALTHRGGISVTPAAHFTVIFGRNEPEVHVCVGEDDLLVSRQHGLLRCDGTRWTLRNTGRIPIRFPGSQLLLSGHEEPLPVAYTPLFIRTAPDREHLLEVRVAGAPSAAPAPRYDQSTRIAASWDLAEREREVLVALGQRYLRHEAHPQPLSWRQVAEELGELQPNAGWTPKRVEHIAAAVRARLVGQDVRGLTREEVGEPVGNALNHNLLLELLLSATLVPPDLRFLNGAAARETAPPPRGRR